MGPTSVTGVSPLPASSLHRVRTEFVGLKSVSDRSLGTLVFIGAAALWVPRSQRDVSLHVWQLGKLSPPAPHTTTCHIRRRLVVGTHSGEPETDPYSVVRQRGISKPARRVEATEPAGPIPGTKRNESRSDNFLRPWLWGKGDPWELL